MNSDDKTKAKPIPFFEGLYYNDLGDISGVTHTSLVKSYSGRSQRVTVCQGRGEYRKTLSVAKILGGCYFKKKLEKISGRKINTYEDVVDILKEHKLSIRRKDTDKGWEKDNLCICTPEQKQFLLRVNVKYDKLNFQPHKFTDEERYAKPFADEKFVDVPKEFIMTKYLQMKKAGNNYSITNYGRVYDNDRQCFCALYLNNSTGYAKFKKFRFFIHRIVAWAFLNLDISNTYGCQVDHINGNKLDNRLSNLRIVSAKQNSNNPLTKVVHREKIINSIGKRCEVILNGNSQVYNSMSLAFDALNVEPRKRVNLRLKIRKEGQVVWNGVVIRKI